MTKNSAMKRAARAYQQAHPGTPFPVALRAVDTRSAGGRPAPAADWSHGSTPWVRGVDGSPAGSEAIICYLCGSSTMMRSWGDLADDHGRIQLYCDNPDCAAREVEMIVLEDGNPATGRRADVRALMAVRAEVRSTIAQNEPDSWVTGTPPWARVIGEPVMCLFCGKRTCTPSPSDAVHDCGRIRWCCTNAQCDVQEVELIVMRDGTPRTVDRPDVSKLRDIDAGPEPTSSTSWTGTPEPRVRRFAGPGEKLARRLGH